MILRVQVAYLMELFFQFAERARSRSVAKKRILKGAINVRIFRVSLLITFPSLLGKKSFFEQFLFGANTEPKSMLKQK
jgi:hypothetical protein